MTQVESSPVKTMIQRSYVHTQIHRWWILFSFIEQCSTTLVLTHQSLYNSMLEVPSWQGPKKRASPGLFFFPPSMLVILLPLCRSDKIITRKSAPTAHKE